MRVEFSFWEEWDSLLGIMTARGADENGEFKMLSIGIVLCEISFYWY